MPNPAPSEHLPTAIRYLLACATSAEGDRCNPECPGYFVNSETHTVERCDECASHHGYTDVADDDMWAALKAVQLLARAIPIDVTPETLEAKLELGMDVENDADGWWDAAHAVTDPVFADLLAQLDATCETRIRVTAAQRSAFLAIAATLPGWADGPDHAPHPIIVTDR